MRIEIPLFTIIQSILSCIKEFYDYNIKSFSRVIENQISSVIRQKGESKNGGNKKAKHAKFSEKWTFFVFCFLVTSVLRFTLLPYYRRSQVSFNESFLICCSVFLKPHVECIFSRAENLIVLLISFDISLTDFKEIVWQIIISEIKTFISRASSN